MIRARTIVLIAVSAAVLAAISRYSGITRGVDSVPTPAATGADSRPVRIERGNLKNILHVDGELRAVRSRVVFANTNEETKITYLPPEGSLVKPGDRLLELDSTTVVTKIKDVEERIVAADNEIVQARSAHEQALREMEVELSRLWLAFEQTKIKGNIPAGLIARREYQENQLSLEKARTEYENHLVKIEQKKKEQAAELQVKIIERQKLNAQLDEASHGLEGMVVKAPSEGMVIYVDHWNERRKIQVGDIVWGGMTVVRLPDLKDMEVLAQVNEVDGPKLSVGMEARVILDSYPDLEMSGRVKEISQTATRANRMAKARIFRAVVSLDKTAPDIMKPGMSARVSVTVSESRALLLVPRSAVRFDNQRAEFKVRAIERGVEQFEARADRDGVVVYKVKWNGDRFQVGESAWSGLPIVEIPDLTTIQAIAYVPEVDLGKVKIDQKVEITIDALPGKVYFGRVQKIGQLVRQKAWDIQNKIIDAEISLDQIDPAIMRPSMSVKVRIESSVLENVLAVPLKAVRNEGDTAKVRLRSDVGWTERPVTLVASNNSLVQIKSGLNPGETVAADFSRVQ